MIDITITRVYISSDNSDEEEDFSISGEVDIEFNNDLVQEIHRPVILNTNAMHIRFATWKEMEFELESDMSTTGMLVFRVPQVGDCTLTVATEWSTRRRYEIEKFKKRKFSLTYQASVSESSKYLQSLLKNSTNIEEAV